MSPANPVRSWPESFPRVVRDLDTRKPALIEASAGTGKTYAIEHLLLRLLIENPDWKLESLLLLSFTEKTAGELRERVRERLRKESGNEADWNGAERLRFHDAWLRCDEISIHTLHGFCHAALRRYALENRALFGADVVDDHALSHEALDALLRGPWARDADRLRVLREAMDMDGGERWREKLVRLSLAWQPARGDSLEPSGDSDHAARLGSEILDAAEILESALRALVDRAEGYSAEAHLLSFSDTKTGRENLRKDPFVKTFRAWEITSALEGGVRAAAHVEFFTGFGGNTRAGSKGFAACLPKNADAPWIALAESADRIRRLGLEAAREAERARLAAKGDAARGLRAQLDAEKRRRGALSYDDMISRVAASVRDVPGFAEKLRRRYNACVVDEFQDTDSQLWELLRALCLEGKTLPLFLVGDPKQAIYGFRGGDLRTYLAARALMRDKAHAGEAQGFGLTENWRSTPDLIEALNAIFSAGSWFGPGGEIPTGGAWHLPERSSEIVFTNAEIPGGPPAGPTVPDPVVFTRAFAGGESKGQTEKNLHAWIASGIARLVNGDAGLRLRNDDKTPRLPAFGDIAVLTRTNFEAQALEKLLRRRGIPVRVRQRGGLFEGPSADALRLLLDLIGDAAGPAAQARILLLPFLRPAGKGRAQWPQGRPENCPPLILRWASLAAAGRWPEFFDSVLYESGYLYRLTAEAGYGSEARNLRALARVLAEDGVKRGGTARDLRDRFDALKLDGDVGGSAGTPAEDAGENRVSILTLHMSKGLEFPVVFLAAAGEPPKPDFYTLREASGFRHVLDRGDEAAREQYFDQAREEDKRLFYVGFTRARDRLYVPLLPAKYSKSGSGPLGSFAADALREAAARRPGLFAEDASENFAEPLRGSLVPDTDVPHDAAWPDRDPWENTFAALAARRRGLASYSGLAKREAGAAPNADDAGRDTANAAILDEQGNRVHREDPAEERFAEFPEDAFPLPLSAADLPPGAHAGNALHALLERADFASVAAEDDPDRWCADPRRLETAVAALKEYGLEAEFAAASLRTVWNTLRMPLPDPAGGPGIRLAEISERRHEVEFLFPFPAPGREGNTPDTVTSELPEDGRIALRGGLLWGFMDLVFRRGGKYYLLDWKSNLLERYDAASVAADMRKHRYALQYQLYSVALDKWLAARLPGYDPEAHFGGVYYLYLRGAAPGRFSGFAFRPSPEELRGAYPARLRAILGPGAGGSA